MDSSVDRVPDYLAPIAGARAWRLAPNLLAKMHGMLWSMAMLKVWPNGKEMVAECDSGHPAPARNCWCGVYAWINPSAMAKHGYMPPRPGAYFGRGGWAWGIYPRYRPPLLGSGECGSPSVF